MRSMHEKQARGKRQRKKTWEARQKESMGIRHEKQTQEASTKIRHGKENRITKYTINGKDLRGKFR